MTTQHDGREEAKTSASKEKADGTPTAARPKRKWKKTCVAPGRQNGSAEAKKTAAAVLEVLAGERRPTEAAQALGVSAMRYYQLECRALQGLLDACEPRPRGPRSNPDTQISRLTRMVDTLRRDVARYQSLARASHRTFGIAPVKTTAKTSKGARKRRRPTVRALKAARGLRAGAAPDAGASTDAKEEQVAS